MGHKRNHTRKNRKLGTPPRRKKPVAPHRTYQEIDAEMDRVVERIAGILEREENGEADNTDERELLKLLEDQERLELEILTLEK